MRKAARFLGFGSLVLGLAVPGATAQTLEETCPGLGEGLGGLIGYVVDSDSETIMPAATVRATWEGGNARTDSGLDGVYRLCGVPVGVALVLQANFAAFAGEPMAHTMAEPFERVDFGISMLAAAASGRGARGDRLIVSLPDGRCPDIQYDRHFLCREGWHLERCSYEDKGRIVARRSGGGTDDTEILDQFVLEAQRAGANAVLNIQGDVRERTDRPGQFILQGLEGLAILLADPSCRG